MLRNMGSYVLINDEFTLDVEACDDDDDDELEIVHEKHIRIETEPECNVENDTNNYFNSDIQIKQEIDYEDNYIGDGIYIDLDNIKTEIEVDLEEDEVGIDVEEEEEIEEKESGIREEKVEQDNIENEKSTEASKEKEQAKEDKLKKEEIKEDTVEDNIEKEQTKEETTEEERREECSTEGKERIEGNTKDEKMKENILEEKQPKIDIIQEKQVPKKIPKTALNKENVTKPQNNRPPPNQKRKFSSNFNPKEPLDRRKSFKNRNKNKRYQPSQYSTSQEHRKKEWNRRRRRLGGEHFYNPNKRDQRYERFNNRSSTTDWHPNTSPDWQIYSTILGVLNQAFGQQMAQNPQMDERSLVPYVPQNRANQSRGRKNHWCEQLNNRPKVWASDFNNATNMPHFDSSIQLQTYTNILQTFSQLSHGGLVQNDTNNVKFQMSFLNVFKG